MDKKLSKLDVMSSSGGNSLIYSQIKLVPTHLTSHIEQTLKATSQKTAVVGTLTSNL